MGKSAHERQKKVEMSKTKVRTGAELLRLFGLDPKAFIRVYAHVQDGEEPLISLRNGKSKSRGLLTLEDLTRILKQAALSKVSDEALYAEIGRRRQAARMSYGGGVPPSCTCGECFKCRRRLAMQRYRAKAKKAAK